MDCLKNKYDSHQWKVYNLKKLGSFALSKANLKALWSQCNFDKPHLKSEIMEWNPNQDLAEYEKDTYFRIKAANDSQNWN